MKIIFIGLFFLFTTSINAQFLKPNEVPRYIKFILDSLYPNNKYTLWKKCDGVTNMLKYQATFSYIDGRTWLKIDSIGRVVEIEKEIKIDSIPIVSKEYIIKNYELKSVLNARKIIINKQQLYFVIIRKNRTIINLLFNNDGSFKEKNSPVSMSFDEFATSVFENILKQIH